MSRRKRLCNRALLEAHRTAEGALADLVRSVDQASPTGRANVHTVLQHPDFKPLRDEVNRLYAECMARGLLEALPTAYA